MDTEELEPGAQRLLMTDQISFKLISGEEYYVCAVATQGHKQGSHWAKSYKLQLSLQATTWETYSEDGAEKVRKLIFKLIFSKFSISERVSFGRLI